MIIGIILILFSINLFANSNYPGGGVVDLDDPPIDLLVRSYQDSYTGTPTEFLEKLFSTGQLDYVPYGTNSEKQTYNLTYAQQKDFMKQYLMKVAIKSSRVSSSKFQDEVKKLAQSTYAPDINYSFIDRVGTLNEEGKTGHEIYEKLIEEEFDKDEIKSMIQEEVIAASAHFGWNEGNKDDLVEFMLENDLADDKFITAQFESMLEDEGMQTSQFGIMQHESMKSKYSELLKKLARYYDPNNEHPDFGGNLLCRTLAATSITSTAPIENVAETTEQNEDINKRRVILEFNNLSRTIAALTEFGKDVTNNNKECFGEKSLADYIEEFRDHPLFDNEDPNLIKWIDTVLKSENAGSCGENQVTNVIPRSLCERDTLLDEATTYLKSIKRTGQNVEHVYAHQINNCLLVLFANLSSTDSATLSSDDFSMEIKYLKPSGPDKIVDKVKETRNFVFFMQQVQKRRDFFLKSMAK
jgi:hypothetical protein